MTNAEALARFESLVQAQKPADTPWQPVTDYSFEARTAIEGKHPDLIVESFDPVRVVDVGCGPGHLVRLLTDRGASVIGIDRSIVERCDGGARFDGPLDERFLYGDITRPSPYQTPVADLVICREVLEHLTVQEIARAVRNLCALSSRFVYVTTRFAKSPDHLLAVDTADDLDPTHITMLNQDFLRVLFVLEGFTRRADLEERLDWQHKGRVLVYERA